MKIANKISLSFFAAGIVFATIVAGGFYRVAEKDMREVIWQSLSNNATAYADEVELYLGTLKMATLSTSKSVVLPKALNTAKASPEYEESLRNATKLLKSKREADASVVEYLLLDSSGVVVASSDDADVGQDKAGDPYFLGALKGVYIKDAYNSPTQMKPLMAVSVPILDRDDRTLLGVLVARITMDVLNRIAASGKSMGNTAETILINRDSYMITPSRFIKDTFLKMRFDTDNSKAVLLHQGREHVEACKKAKDIYLDYRGVAVLGTHEFIPEMRWGLIAKIDVREALEPVRKLRILTFIMLCLIPFIAWWVGVVIAASITGPLHKLHKGTEIIGNGNLDHKVGIDTQDEVGQLSRAFDSMTSSLKKTTASIGALDQEIGVRKKTEQDLMEREESYRALFENSRDAIMTLSPPSWKFASCNRATLEMFRAKNEEAFKACGPWDVSPSCQPDGRASSEKAKEAIGIAMDKGFHSFAWTHKRLDGEEFPTTVLLSRMKTRQGLFLQATVRDITQQRQNEQWISENRRHLDERTAQLNAALTESQQAHEILTSMLDDNNQMRTQFESTAKKLELILSSTGEGIFGLDLEGKHTFVNEKALKILGYTEQEVIGKFSHSLWHHSHFDGSPYPANECPNYRALRDGEPRQGEEYYWRKDGTGFPAAFSVVPLLEDGKPIGVVVSFHDITERKRGEEALRNQKMVLSAIANSAQDAILMMDPDGNISFWNPAAERIFGWNEQEALGKNLHALIAPERYHEAQRSAFPHFLATGEGAAIGQTLELSGIRNDKTEFQLEMALSGVFLAGKWHSVAIIRDITARKRAEESLIKLSRAVEQSSATIVITDLTGAIEYANPRFTQTTGYTFEEAKGKNPRVLKSGEMPAEGYKQLWDTILAGGEWHGEFHNKKKNGELYWESASISPIRTAKGEITHFLAVTEDITEKKKQHEQMDLLIHELKDANLQVEMAMRAKGQFLANMSHEIRTPMNAILGFLELLRSTPLNDQQKDYLETVSSSGEVLLAIINDILDLSKIEAGEVHLEAIDFNLEHLVEDVVRMIRPKVAGRSVQLNYHIEEEVPRNLKGDPTRVRQILLNLLSNASKFTDKGEINLRIEFEKAAENGQRFLRCSVRDTGIGIPVKKHASIFDHFTQVDASTTRKYGGTGLGLSICRDLVKLMGGKIWVESAEGKGSHFIFTLPFVAGSGVAETAIQPVGVDELRGLKVLVVDDAPKATQMLRLICEGFGMIVSEAKSGPEALDQLSKLSHAGESPGLAILDIMMPTMDGYELARKIRAHPDWGKMKIIAATSDVRVGMAEDLRRNGFDAFLPKPITKRELISVIRTVLGDRRPDGGIVTRHTAQEFVCKGMKVLVAEDNPVNQKLMLILLKNLGCLVDCVGNGDEAIQKVKANSYDVCLMDLQMPVMGGVEATRLIRGDITKELPIIALTAAVLAEDREESHRAGMNDFLTKPVKPQELKDMLLRWGKRDV